MTSQLKLSSTARVHSFLFLQQTKAFVNVVVVVVDSGASSNDIDDAYSADVSCGKSTFWIWSW